MEKQNALDELNEIYKKIKSYYTNRSFIPSISEKSFEEGYSRAMSNINDEYKKYTNKEDFYSIITDSELCKKKLITELSNIVKKFTIEVQSLTPEYIKKIELELLHNKIIEEEKIKLDKIHAEKLNFLNTKTSFVIGNGNSVWF
jgi:C-terminal processing protease CtpA/Prc